MSVAIDFASEYADEYCPDYDAPFVAPTGPARLASVTTLHAPPARAITPALRLTRRGAQVLAAAVAVLAIGVVALARGSAPSGEAPRASIPDTVTVQAGDTLWSIASRLAPQADPQAEIGALQRLNHLGGVAVVPGQVLRTH